MSTIKTLGELLEKLDKLDQQMRAGGHGTTFKVVFESGVDGKIGIETDYAREFRDFQKSDPCAYDKMWELALGKARKSRINNIHYVQEEVARKERDISEGKKYLDDGKKRLAKMQSAVIEGITDDDGTDD
jgi:hypothetical protein